MSVYRPRSHIQRRRPFVSGPAAVVAEATVLPRLQVAPLWIFEERYNFRNRLRAAFSFPFAPAVGIAIAKRQIPWWLFQRYELRKRLWLSFGKSEATVLPRLKGAPFEAFVHRDLRRRPKVAFTFAAAFVTAVKRRTLWWLFKDISLRKRLQSAFGVTAVGVGIALPKPQLAPRLAFDRRQLRERLHAVFNLDSITHVSVPLPKPRPAPRQAFDIPWRQTVGWPYSDIAVGAQSLPAQVVVADVLISAVMTLSESTVSTLTVSNASVTTITISDLDDV